MVYPLVSTYHPLLTIAALNIVFCEVQVSMHSSHDQYDYKFECTA